MGATELEPPQSEAASTRGVCTEQEIIDALVRAAPARRELRVGQGDDCAVLPDGLAITVDQLCEGVHFDARLAPGDVAFKAVAASVSDLAATGATPERFVLCLAHPRPTPDWVHAFAAGIGEASRAFGIDLVGGDTTRGGQVVVAVTAFGTAPRPLTRAGAAPGDTVYVAGPVGLAGAGYLLDDPPADALAALRRPMPPVGFALALVAAGLASAGMDLSDGPARDLPRLARASGVGIALDPAKLPAPAWLAAHPRRRAIQLGGGDDYALLFTSAADPAELFALAAAHETELAAVGEVVDGEGAWCVDGPWPAAWAHFGEGT